MKSHVDDATTKPGFQPYVGPRSIGVGEPLYGRNREIRELRDTLISQRIVFLYSPSGAGKSSLLEAGLRPQLEDRGFHVLPTVRIGSVLTGSGNRYVRSLVASLREALPNGGSAEASPEVHDVAGFLEWMTPRCVGTNKDACLFIDQFEELFTLDPTDRDAKREFVRQLGVALRDNTLWVLISMREDFIAQLDPFLPLIPTRLSARFRLDLLDREAATEAARRPAQSAGVDFSAEAAHRLIDDLRSIRVKRGDTVTTELGPYVEPVQLQVVCGRLWNNLSRVAEKDEPTGLSIGLEDVIALGNVDSALADLFDRQVAGAAATTGVDERRIRDWIETELITDGGFRSQTLHGPDGEDTSVPAVLEDGHLLRSESRRGTSWYEIAHDRLVEPILRSNRLWRKDNLSLLQVQAGEWEAHERTDALLLRGEILDNAESWAAQNTNALSLTDSDFLAASVNERTSRLDARRRQRRDRVVAIGAAALSLVATTALVLALVARADANREADRANAALNDVDTLVAELEELIIIRGVGDADSDRLNELASTIDFATAPQNDVQVSDLEVVEITDTSAKVVFETDECVNAIWTVSRFGTSGGDREGCDGTSHQLLLGRSPFTNGPLSPDTTYTVDVAGVLDGGSLSAAKRVRFTTLPEIETPPEIRDLAVSEITARSAVVTFKVDQCTGARFSIDGVIYHEDGYPVRSDQCWVNQWARVGTMREDPGPLEPDTTYTVEVVAVRRDGVPSEPQTITFRTSP